MIDPSSGVPLHRQLAAELRAHIVAGEWQPGGLLPPVQRLRWEYGLGKATVQAAIALLRAEGLVAAERGVGVRVRGQVEKKDLLVDPDDVVEARMPTPAERAEHQLADGVPMLVVTHTDGLVDVFPADQYRVRISSS